MKLSLLPESISHWLSSKSKRQSQFILSQKNIYIFPSKMGFVFVLLIMLMLLTAINYQSSLIYLFTFFLGAVFFVSILLCFLNLNGLNVSSIRMLTCFEGELCPHEIQLKTVSQPSLGLRVGENKHLLNQVSIHSNEKIMHNLLLPAVNRGLHTLDRLRIESTYPFGFILAWTWLKLDSKVLVFPKAVEGSRSHGGGGGGIEGRTQYISEDLTELKSYQQGDSALRIVWKQLAAKDQLIIRTPELGTKDSTWLTWALYDGVSTERRLQHLCFDILDLDNKHQIFGLNIPGVLIAPSSGEQHKHECLQALALFDLDAEKTANDSL